MIASLSASVSVRKVCQLVLSCCLQRKRPSPLLVALTSTIAQQLPWMQQRQTAKPHFRNEPKDVLLDRLLFCRQGGGFKQV